MEGGGGAKCALQSKSISCACVKPIKFDRHQSCRLSCLKEETGKQKRWRSGDTWAHTVANLRGHNRLNSNQGETLRAGCHMWGSDSTSGLWQREWHGEKEEGVCQGKERESTREREGIKSCYLRMWQKGVKVEQ